MRFVSAFVISLLAVGCSSGRTDSGQTGSLGPSADECDMAAECDARAAAEVARFSQAALSSLELDSAACTEVGIVGGPSGPTCQCSIAGGSGTLNVGPVGLDCYHYGRAGDCLWLGREFEGCDVTQADSCDAVCQDLQDRIDTDGARTFEASVEYVACEAHQCQTVLEIEGRCFAQNSYQSGRAYDCSLGGEAILAAEKAAGRPPEQDERPETRSPYVAGTDGFVALTFARNYAGTSPGIEGFGAMAQLFHAEGGNVDYGEIIDPLEGIDDCGVFKGSGNGAGGPSGFYDAGEIQLLDDGVARPFELAAGSSNTFFNYILELDGTAPRFGGSYGVHVAGGSFGSAFDSGNGLHLPADLVIDDLTKTPHFEQRDMQLSWTGTGSAPLYFHLIVSETLSGFFSNYELQCLVKDDGHFVIPAEVLLAMPTGFASLSVMREDRRIVKSGQHSLLFLGSVQVSHQFVLGPKCEAPEVLEACQTSAASVVAAYDACNVPPPPVEQLCPDFLSTVCDLCPEYFECMARQTQCTDQGLTSGSGCTCAGN